MSHLVERTAPLVCALLALAGCSQILGVDDYENAPAREAVTRDAATDGDALRDGGTLFKPRPYLTGEECKVCLSTKCDAAGKACAKDDLCMRATAPERTPPYDYQTRYLPTVSDQKWDWEHETGQGNDYNPLLKALISFTGCLMSNCAEACPVQRDFSCVGAFDWPPTDPGEKTLRFRFLDSESGLGVPDAAVQYCTDLMCDDLGSASHTKTDQQGFASLTVDVDIPLPSRLAGQVVVDAGAGYSPFTFSFAPAPIKTDFYDGRALLVPNAVLDNWSRITKAAVDRSLRSEIWVLPKDCRGDDVKHVVLEILTVAGEGRQGYEPCTECGIGYADADGLPDPGRDEVATDGIAIAYAVNVPPVATLVVVRDTATRRVVAVQRLFPRAGYIHNVVMYPASKIQLDDLPEAR